jgi:lipid-A-disaccharide synthase-like uncharacterized protein
MATMTGLIILLGALAFGLVCALIGHAKRRDPIAFFFWGLVGGVFGLAYAILARSNPRNSEDA